MSYGTCLYPKNETITDYKERVEWLEANGYSIVAVVCDGLKGLRAILSDYEFQLCQFHQVMTIKTKLTMHPKLEASKELRALSRLLCHTDKESFIGAFEAWEKKWDTFLRERAEDANGKSRYIHKELRSAYLSLKRNMPWLKALGTCYRLSLHVVLPRTDLQEEALFAEHRQNGLQHRHCL